MKGLCIVTIKTKANNTSTRHNIFLNNEGVMKD